ncbi:hypothetical protein K9N68_23270 [Kovacikia minuta CCNUW1]|uniref:hypothetical protein n=1 Tax=Kovacikia minuta TaxID=2931930 RepID=UPI001CCE059C|nr:hypothetical protein [Kovacikia minuta]UBF24583.1 hypothetical protein K9N68_23270 [Kovacikia minuta CCNUW1]
MTTSQPNLLQLAREGDTNAISSLLNRSLKPKGISTKAALNNGCLQIKLEADQLPHQSCSRPIYPQANRKFWIYDNQSCKALWTSDK